MPGGTTWSMQPMPVEPIARPKLPIFALNLSPWPLSRNCTSATFITGLIASAIGNRPSIGIVDVSDMVVMLSLLLVAREHRLRLRRYERALVIVARKGPYGVERIKAHDGRELD